MRAFYFYTLISTAGIANAFHVGGLGRGTVAQSSRVLRAVPTDEVDLKGISGMKGYYRRPSRAIEKGGGFYVPGLEGERIRVLTAAALVLMYVTNRAGQTVASLPQVISELTGLSLALLLFVQGAADAFLGPEIDSVGNYGGSTTASSTLSSTAAFLTVLQKDPDSLSSPAVSIAIAETVARSAVQTSPATTSVMLLSPSAAGVVTVSLELGPVGRQPLSSASASAIYKAFTSTSTVSSNPDQSSAGKVKVILLPYNDFSQRVGANGLGNAELLLPAGTPTAVVVVAVVETAGNPLLWLLGCATDEVDVGWAKTLLNAPLSER